MSQPVQLGIPNMIGAPHGLPFGIPSPSYVNRSPAQRPVPAPEVPGEGLKRALNYLADYGGCGYYRCMAPNLLLNLYQKAVIMESTAMVLDPKF